MKKPGMDCNCPQCRAAGRYAAAADAAVELDYRPSSVSREEEHDSADAGLRYRATDVQDPDVEDDLDADEENDLDDDEEDDLDDDEEGDLDDDENDFDVEDDLDEDEDEDDFEELDEGDGDAATAKEFEFAPDVGQFDAEVDDEAWETDDEDFREVESDDFDADDDAFDTEEALHDWLSAESGSYDTSIINNPCRFIRRIRVWRGAGSNDKMISGQQEALCAAVTMAAGWAEMVRNAYQDIYRHRKHRRRRVREWKTAHGGAFAYWFGARWTGRAPLYTVYRRIKKMQRFFERGLRFTIIKEQGGYRSYNCNTVPGHNAAYTLAPVIYICPDFFRSDTIRQARILIHELTHRIVQPGTIAGMFLSPFTGLKGLAGFIAFGHPVIGGHRVRSNEDARQARALARRRPFAARRSPVNFARLYQEIGTGISTRGLEG